MEKKLFPKQTQKAKRSRQGSEGRNYNKWAYPVKVGLSFVSSTSKSNKYKAGHNFFDVGSIGGMPDLRRGNSKHPSLNDKSKHQTVTERS